MDQVVHVHNHIITNIFTCLSELYPVTAVFPIIILLLMLMKWKSEFVISPDSTGKQSLLFAYKCHPQHIPSDINDGPIPQN